MPLKRIEQLLLARIGLDAPSLGPGAVAVAVRTRMAALAIKSQSEYLERVLADEAEKQVLVEEIVVSESWFFREPAAYELMCERLAPFAKRGDPVRVLCVPCATGEEPYSVVMMLREAAHKAENIQVHGVDVSSRALGQARSGLYSRNSFRSKNERFEHYFKPVESGYALAEEVRNRVLFVNGNVLDARLLAGSSFHAIFCRNLLIYLDRPSRATALLNLARMLRPDGVLFVGHSEASDVATHDFVRTGDPRSFAFLTKAAAAAASARGVSGQRASAPRRPSTISRESAHERATVRVPASRPHSVRPALASSALGVARALAARHSQRPASRRSVPVPAPTRGRELLDLAREQADRGALSDALQSCERALLYESGTSCEVQSLMGILKRAAGDNAGARAAFEAALRVDPNHYETLVHLALQADAESNLAAAQAYRARAAHARKV